MKEKIMQTLQGVVIHCEKCVSKLTVFFQTRTEVTTNIHTASIHDHSDFDQ